MNEIAFLMMDLIDHGLPRLAYRFLNAYLEHTGDYAGLRVLRFYLVYRALVRAKVSCMRAHQPGMAARARSAIEQEYRRHLHLASAWLRRGTQRCSSCTGCPGRQDHGRPGSARSPGRGAPALRRGTQRLHGYAAGARSHSN